MIEPARGPRGQRRWLPRLIAAVIILALLVIFIVQNDDEVPVRLLFWTLDIPLAAALFIAAALGAVFGWLVPRLRRS